ncbi:lysophospholipid acyltransferase family protein [Lysobacter xanthus]
MRRALRAVGLIACVLVLGGAQALVLLVGGARWPIATSIPRLFHASAGRLLGLRVRVAGRPITAPRTVWVCNHLSYLDIVVLGALLPGRFVAKREVRDWPAFGVMARLQRTVFIGRRARDSIEAVDAMGAALDEGASLILFPEGTTTDGCHVLPFRSAAFAPLVARAGITVQPVTLRVQGGSPAGPRRAYAYIDDDRLLPHLLRFLDRRRTDVEVTLHPPLHCDAGGNDRKAVACAAQRIVAAALALPAP